MGEVWLPIAGRDGYEVSSLGNVRSYFRRGHSRKFDTPRQLKLTLGSFGYPVVNLGGKTFQVHVLVCTAFHGPRPKGFDAAHADGSRDNNNAMNLRWCSRADNIRDAHKHGTMGRGGRAQNVKLTIGEVREIRRLRDELGMGCSAIAKHLGHPRSRVNNVYSNQWWRGVA